MTADRSYGTELLRAPELTEFAEPPEPLAIVGIGCRLPGGVDSPDAYWNLLTGGVDAIVDVPPGRWDFRQFYDPDPAKPGKSYARQAGFLTHDPYSFDPTFFGISPREAEVLDPQQRLLLEATWEAFEDAGIQVERLSGSDTGVFIGGFTTDHQVNMLGAANREIINNHSPTGTCMTVLASRLSYTFNLMGPSVSMDTACSSSLVAGHYACQSLWTHECDLAILGGVNVMTIPEYFVAMSKGRFLSPDARCRAFDKDASGYARGEGAGVLLLKRLSAALRDCDTIYALVRGSGVNQDGQTNGMPFPNPNSQERLIRQVCQRAGVSPGRIAYVEAHGTGTQAGDFAEASALHAALSEGRSQGEICRIGSVKTNIGHLEAAAGVAGLIKAALCLKHREVPPNLHYRVPNPKIPFDDYCLRVVTERTPLEPIGPTLLAGVNSFGFGGTNAHIVLEEAPERNEPPATDSPSDRPVLVTLSAHDPDVLENLADEVKNTVTESSAGTLHDLAYTTNRRRSHLRHRLAVAADSLDDVVSGLKEFVSGGAHPALVSGHVLGDEERKVVFVYTGMGPQWWGMGRELAEREPVFRAALTECDQRFAAHAGWSVLEALGNDPRSSRVSEAQVAQPANFLIQMALTRLLASWGVRPDAVVGHSVGEVASAWASGALTLEDALRVSHHRSRLQQTTAGKGGMMALGLGERDASALVARRGFDDRLSIAAVNSGRSVTLAGEKEALSQLATGLETDGVFHRLLDVDVAYHSQQMEPIRGDLEAALSDLRPGPADVPLYSTVTGGRLDGAALSSDYWWANVRSTVRFNDAVKALLADGCTVLVEVGPHPVLRHAIQEILRDSGSAARLIPTLDRKKPETQAMIQTLATLYTLGFPLDWEAVAPKGRRVSLPSYPWKRSRYQLESRVSREYLRGTSGHPILNRRTDVPAPTWQVELSAQLFPFLPDHKVGGATVVPGAFYVEAGLAVGETLYKERACIIKDLAFHQVLATEAESLQDFLTTYEPKTQEFTVYSNVHGTAEDEVAWKRHAVGKVMPITMDDEPQPLDMAHLRSNCPARVDVDALYDVLEESGLSYGPHFRTMVDVPRGAREVLARIERPKSRATHNQTERNDASVEKGERYLLHPTLLDGCFQALLAAVDRPSGAPADPFVPVFIEKLSLYAPVEAGCWCFGRIVAEASNEITGEIDILDEAGRVCARVQGLRCRAIAGPRSTPKSDELYYRSVWEACPLAPTEAAEAAGSPGGLGLSADAGGSVETDLWLVVADNEQQASPVQDALERQGASCVLATSTDRDDFIAVCKELAPRPFSTVLLSGSVVPDSSRSTGERTHTKREASTDREGESADHSGVIAGAATREALRVVHLVQALAETVSDRSMTLGIVTFDAQAVAPDDEISGLDQSPLWGLGQLIGQEHPHLRCKLIDVASAEWAQAASAVAAELTSGNRDADVALRSGARFVMRFDRAGGGIDEPRVVERSSQDPIRLELTRPGDLDSLAYFETERRPPGPGEIEVAVCVGGLNYKDVLKATGALSPSVYENTWFGTRLGMDGAGRVTAVGEGVTKFEVGDEVAFLESGFRTYATIPASLAIRIPSKLTMEEAPVLMPFLTAHYGLQEVARIRSGESVLVHNGSGGVGLAAIQIAHLAGATVFATAGTESKRAYLRELGVEHVFHSRTLDFATQIRRLTEGRGVDVVIGAAEGQVMLESFALLAPYGRYVELGKQGAMGGADLPMAAFNKHLTFASVDIDRLALDRTDVVGQHLHRIGELFEAGRLRSIPVTTFPAREVEQAFSLMVASEHVGKVVVRMEGERVSAHSGARRTLFPDPDATYLITGGTGGFGLELAVWLAENGVGGLALVSRSGVATDEARAAVRRMESCGTRVVVGRVDVTDPKQVDSFVTSLRSGELPPLKGVYHAATVLDDAFLVDIDKERLEYVMAPKVRGALNVHEATKEDALDFFVCFSSVSSVIGNVGQCNYVAANAFLDAFAHYRRALGYPATTINLGALAEAGIVSRNERVAKMFESSGVKGISTETALREIARITQSGPTQIGLIDLDWGSWGRVFTVSRDSSRFARLMPSSSEGGAQNLNGQTALLERIGALEGGERLAAIRTELIDVVADLLRLSPDKVDVKASTSELGMDSLVFLELQLAISNRFDVELSSMELLKGPSVDQLVAVVDRAIVGPDAPEKDSHHDPESDDAA